MSAELPVIHQDPFCVEPFYSKHDYQRVIMRLPYSPGICFIERHVLICSFLLEWRHRMDAVDLSLVCLLEGLE